MRNPISIFRRKSRIERSQEKSLEEVMRENEIVEKSKRLVGNQVDSFIDSSFNTEEFDKRYFYMLLNTVDNIEQSPLFQDFLLGYPSNQIERLIKTTAIFYSVMKEYKKRDCHCPKFNINNYDDKVTQLSDLLEKYYKDYD